MSPVVRSVYSACLAMIAGLAVSAGEAKPPIDTFSFIHMSDIHVDPWLVMPSMEETTSARSYRSLRTLVKRDNVFLEPYNITAPKPSFIIATGDICEFGAPGFTWDVVERYFEGLPKYYLAPGNHDNTWVFSSQYFKKKFGGFSYSFDHGGIHFICLNSASLQDPNPSFSQEVVEFVKRDLKKVDPQTPIIPYCHHPWHGAEFASRYDADRLLDLFRPYNLVMILDGHGHASVTQEIGGVDAVMGGSTFSKLSALTDGYNIVDVRNNTLTVAYKRIFESSATKKMIQKDIPDRSTYPVISISAPQDRVTIKNGKLPLSATVAGKSGVSHSEYSIDDDSTGPMKLGNGSAEATVDISGLSSGAHYVRITFFDQEGKSYYKTSVFYSERADSPTAVWRCQIPAGSKTTPLVLGDRVYVGANDGNMYAIEKKSGKIAWAFKTGGEILSSPAEYAGSIVFGSADGKLYRVSSKGKQVWACNTGGEICAAPLVDGEFIYVGGRNARFFAVQANTGKIAWKNEDAAYNIESKASSDANHVYFGAWDGNLYCLDKKTGKTAWKSPGPTNQVVKDNLARYHAPADNGPVAVDDRVFIADRGSEAGSYTQKGDFETTISSDCTAIGLSENRVALYLRLVRGPVTKIDLAGHELWESKTRTGRVPVSPLEKAGVVYVCSNRGKLSALDAANGQEKWTYQVTPQLYVMAGIALDSNIAYTCGLDGVVTAIKFP